MISYAIIHEDVLLNRLFRDQTNGFYIDVGANHPTAGSVTKHFYDRGWRGVNIEPNPLLLKLLFAERPEDSNLGMGLAKVPGRLTFYRLIEDHGLSSFSLETAERHRTAGLTVIHEEVEVQTLTMVCNAYVAGRTIDFLKIDVEGYEAEVLAGADFTRFRPRAVVIEATLPNTNIPAHYQWEPPLLAAGYLFAFFDGFNRFYLRVEDAELLPRLIHPASPLDDFVPHRQHELETLLAKYQSYGRVAHMVARTVQRVVNATRGIRRRIGDIGSKAP